MRKTIDLTIAIFLSALLALMLACVVWQVLSRYVLDYFPELKESLVSLSPKAEEVARFGLIWLGVIGAGYVTGLKKHLAIDLLINAVSPSAQKILGILIEIATISFALIVMIYGGYDLMSKTFTQGQVSPVIGFPMGYIYLSIPLSGVMVTGYSIVNLIERFTAQPVQK